MRMRFSSRKQSNEAVGLPWWLSGKASACQCRRHRFDPWSRKIPHAMEHLSPMCCNYWACALEPRTWNFWDLNPREQQEKPPRWGARALRLESSPRLRQLVKSPGNKEDPAQQKTKNKKQKKTTVITGKPSCSWGSPVCHQTPPALSPCPIG